MSRATVYGRPNFQKKAGKISGVSAVLLGSNQATITWVNPPPAIYDFIYLERNIGGAGWVLVAVPTKGDTSYIDTQGYSVDTIWSLTPCKTAWSNGVYGVEQTGTVRSVPQVPSISDLHRVSGPPANVFMSGPDNMHANMQNYDVASSTDGGASWTGPSGTIPVNGGGGNTWYTGPSGLFGMVSPTGNVTARIRARDTFGQVSAWNVWPATIF